MEFNDPGDFSDGLGILVGGVRRWDNKLGRCSRHVGTPIGNDAVGGIRRIVASAITDDGVVRDTRGDGNGIDGFDKAVVGGKGVNAVGDALEVERAGLKT